MAPTTLFCQRKSEVVLGRGKGPSSLCWAPLMQKNWARSKENVRPPTVLKIVSGILREIVYSVHLCDLLGGLRPEQDLKAGVQFLSTQSLQLDPSASIMQSNMQLSFVQPVSVPKQSAQAAVYPRRFSMHLDVHEAPPRHWWPQALRSLWKSALPSLFQTAWSAALHDDAVAEAKKIAASIITEEITEKIVSFF